MKAIIKAAAALAVILAVFTTNAAAAEEPDVKALGAVLVDEKSGRVLWEKDSDLPLANASTTKIMTCILAVESGMLEDTVIVSKNAAVQPKTKMGLSTGEEIKLKDLLYALMLQSSNDAAVAIAEHISGSVDSFCDLMDKKARELGAEDTDFETPNGLDSGEHHSTAHDMALIARYAMENDTFKEIIQTRNITVSSNKRTYSIVNKNRLLNEYNGALGIKTGFTGKAGHCFVGAAERDGMTLISVVLGSGWGNTGKERKWTDTKNLLNYGFENFKYYDICVAGDYIDTFEVANSYRESVDIITAESINLPLSEEERKGLYIEVKLPETVEAPVRAGQKMGEMVFKTDSDTVIAVCSLEAKSSVDKKDVKTTAEMLIKYWNNPMKSYILGESRQ